MISSDDRSLGFSLIELMAVIAITSLTFVIAAVHIGSVQSHVNVRRLLGDLRSMDARARLHARHGNDIVYLEIVGDSSCVRLIGMIEGQPFVLGERSFPPHVQVSLENSFENSRISYDRLGRSEDFEVNVRGEARQFRLIFAGLTGDVRLLEDSP